MVKYQRDKVKMHGDQGRFLTLLVQAFECSLVLSKTYVGHLKRSAN